MEIEGATPGLDRGPDLPGPFSVGRYAKTLRDELRKRARVLLIGEITGLRRTQKQAYFELRDGDGAVPCTIWADDLARLQIPDDALRDGAEFVVAGGPDYFIGSATSSPAFSFRATHLRLAGEGDLLARLEALRKQLRSEGLFELQKQLLRPRLPRTIGAVTAEGGAARRDLVAGLRRRGWAGTVIWAFAPVQDRRAAPAIAGAIQDLAATPAVEAIVVTRGGGSLADLWAFCDETLCRTVAMLRVPVISAVGHERDSTLIDDVAAVACSTPTHAAEAAVPLDCNAARGALLRSAAALRRSSAVVRPMAPVWLGRLERSASGALDRQRVLLRHVGIALRAHEPERTLERGYALAEDAAGEPVTGAAEALAAGRVRLRFADGSVGARIEQDGTSDE